MLESEAMTKICPILSAQKTPYDQTVHEMIAFDNESDFVYCQGSRCVSWDWIFKNSMDGYCQALQSGKTSRYANIAHLKAPA